MAKLSNILAFAFVLLVIFSQSAFAARKLQMNNGFNANVVNNNNNNNEINENDNKNNENVVYATREGPSGNDHANGLTDNKNFIYGGVGSAGGIGSGVGIVGPLGGVGFGSGIGVASGIGGVGLLPAGGIGGVGGVGGVGGGVGGVGGGLGGIVP